MVPSGAATWVPVVPSGAATWVPVVSEVERRSVNGVVHKGGSNSLLVFSGL